MFGFDRKPPANDNPLMTQADREKLQFELNNQAAAEKYNDFINAVDSASNLDSLEAAIEGYVQKEENVKEIPELPNPDTWPRTTRRILINFIEGADGLEWSGEDDADEVLSIIADIKNLVENPEEKQNILKRINQLYISNLKQKLVAMLEHSV